LSLWQCPDGSDIVPCVGFEKGLRTHKPLVSHMNILPLESNGNIEYHDDLRAALLSEIKQIRGSFKPYTSRFLNNNTKPFIAYVVTLVFFSLSLSLLLLHYQWVRRPWKLCQHVVKVLVSVTNGIFISNMLRWACCVYNSTWKKVESHSSLSLSHFISTVFPCLLSCVYVWMLCANMVLQCV